jgi:tetratricopeptide (TPR) repeat protein
VAVLKGDLEVGAKYMEEALTVYRSHIHAHHFSATEAEDTKIAVSEVYYSLAETYLQLGRYHDSKDRYRQGSKSVLSFVFVDPFTSALRAISNRFCFFPNVVAWNELYNIEQPPEESLILEGFGDATDAIEEYERVLHEYEELRGGGADDGMGGGQFVDEITGEILDRDDGYEGDLHSGLGSLYMAKGDYVLAASHLTEAVRLYELSGEQQERSMADAKFNLSILHLRNGAYMESANLYSEALDIYEAVTVEGENPLDGMDASELLTALQEQFPAFSQAAEQKETTPQPEGNGARVGPAAGDDSTKDGPPAMVLDVNAFLQQNQSSIKDEL